MCPSRAQDLMSPVPQSSPCTSLSGSSWGLPLNFLHSRLALDSKPPTPGVEIYVQMEQSSPSPGNEQVDLVCCTEWEQVIQWLFLLAQVFLTLETTVKQISKHFKPENLCCLKDFCLGRQTQVSNQNPSPLGISQLSRQAYHPGLVATQVSGPSTWLLPSQGFLGISCTAGLLVLLATSFSQSRLCLTLNRCLFFPPLPRMTEWQFPACGPRGWPEC